MQTGYRCCGERIKNKRCRARRCPTASLATIVAERLGDPPDGHAPRRAASVSPMWTSTRPSGVHRAVGDRLDATGWMRISANERFQPEMPTGAAGRHPGRLLAERDDATMPIPMPCSADDSTIEVEASPIYIPTHRNVFYGGRHGLCYGYAEAV